MRSPLSSSCSCAPRTLVGVEGPLLGWGMGRVLLDRTDTGLLSPLAANQKNMQSTFTKHTKTVNLQWLMYQIFVIHLVLALHLWVSSVCGCFHCSLSDVSSSP